MVKVLENKINSQAAPTGRSRFSLFVWWAILFAASMMMFSYFFGDKQKTPALPDASPVVNEVTLDVAPMAISGDKISATARGIRVSDIDMHDYPGVKLLSDGGYAEVGFTASGTGAPNANTQWRATRMSADNAMMWRNADGIDFVRATIIDGYTVTIRDTIKNSTSRDVSFAPYARIVRAAVENNPAVETGAVVNANSDIEYNDYTSLDDESFIYQTVNGFAGFADQYWETVAMPGSADQTISAKKVGEKYQIEISAAPVNVASGTSVIIETKLFAGPRDPKALAASGIANLSDTMDYGWFWFLSRPMLFAMNALHGIIGNYGVAIILLTIALRLLMWPLTRKSYTSMAAMQKMQPELQRVQKLYANDKARLQMEMMRVYQSHKTSPMSGCLPMLLQIPIFFALYKALLISVPMRAAGFLWIPDLAAMDPYFILPVLMGLTMWWQQKLQQAQSVSESDPAAQMQRVMKWMPAMLTLLFAWMPAGLVLYWTVSNIVGLVQIWIIKRKA